MQNYGRPKTTRIGFALAIACALGACSSGETKSVEQTAMARAEPTTGHPTTGNSLQTKFVAAEQGASATAELSFAKGSSQLPKDAANRLKKALREAASRGPVSEVKIIAWADKEYPSTYNKALPTSERKLAEQRAQAVAQFLEKATGGATVQSINMAERPGAMARFLKTSDFRVKRSLERAGIPNEDTSVKVPAMERKALVLVFSGDAKAVD